MGKQLLFGLLIVLFFLSSCKRSKQGKSDIEIAFTKDTLEVGYTYWWPESGPFIGQCGEEFSLVFSGTITNILEPTDEAGPLYTSQKGYILLNQVFKIMDMGVNGYANEQYFTSDCFNGLGLKKGDNVLVFCYDYENALSIPGGRSILKIESMDSPLIDSIKKYIDSGENPSKIKTDLKLWDNESLGENLRQIIACSEVVD